MIRKYIYGTPFETEAVVTDIAQTDGTPASRGHFTFIFSTGVISLGLVSGRVTFSPSPSRT